MKKHFSPELKAAVIATVPVLSAYVVIGIGFGLVMKAAGFGPLWTLAMSATIFAGSMQYAAVGLMAAAAPIAAVALTTLAVNLRHLFYGISMLEKYKGTGWRKPLLIFWLTDETYSLVCGECPAGVQDVGKYRFLVSLLDYLYWLIGSMLGALLGDLAAFNAEGVEFSMAALFLTVFLEQWLSARDHRSALIGLAVPIICLLIFGSGDFLIPALAGIAVILLLMGKKEGRY